MVFTTYVFLFAFLGTCLLAYYLSPPRLRSVTLTFFSLVFYGWWRPDFVLLLLFSCSVDYVAGWRLHGSASRGRRVGWLLVSLICNLGLLAYFKYANFGIDTLNQVLRAMDMAPVGWMEVVLPVGISFYTFQSMSYTIDVFRREVTPVRNPIDFLCYVSLFPQLVAGPIVRYRDIAEQLRNRSHTWGKLACGALLFQIGFIKKVLIADQVGSIADQLYGHSQAIGESALAAAMRQVPGISDPSFAESWLGTIGYGFQIYFDFSGYSDMAIGLGMLFGFVFPINFNSPYQSRSITDFWRRWHISLSTWLRDYLYVPLGGNRKGPARTYVNLALTMLLGGLWHGAAWTFIAWGAYQGLWLVAERFFGKRAFYSRLPVPGQILLTFLLVMIGWVFFRADNLSQAFEVIGGMFGLSSAPALSLNSITLEPAPLYALVAAVLIAFFVRPSQEIVSRPSPLTTTLVPLLFLVAVVHIFFQAWSPFLYFQF